MNDFIPAGSNGLNISSSAVHPPGLRMDEVTYSSAEQPGDLAAENRRLRDKMSKLKAENEARLERERKIMELLGTKSPDQILHDFRNVLNERELFRVLAFRDEK